MNRSFVFSRQCVVKVPRRADRELIDRLLHSHVFGVDFEVEESTDDCVISIGSASEAPLGDAEAVLHITEHGIGIRGKDFFAAMRGFVTMLTRIECNKADKTYYVLCGVLQEKPYIAFRSVHLCVFPETSFAFLQKCIRSCGMEKYSHVILEFWGMLRYDCMKELGWSMALEKTQIRKLVQEANTFGMEVIPMFNHLGHASGCRAMNGKHVVLDQNPAYEYLFDFDGWVWDYELEELVWERPDYNRKYFDDKYVISGHTPTMAIENNPKPGYIYQINNHIAIDCGCSFPGGRLGCLRLEDMKEFYIE